MSGENCCSAGFRMRTMVCALALVAGTAFVTRQVMSEPPAKSDMKAGQKEMTAEEKDMMDKMMAAGTPGKNHQLLESRIGEWNTQCKFWMGAGAPAEEHAGTSSTKWILDKHYLQQDFGGEMGPNMPFKGLGITAYDNLKKKYVNLWLDSMSTAVFMDEGTVDATGKVFESEGTNTCCVTGKPAKTRSIYRIIDNSKHTFEMWGPDPKTGKEYKSMEITYTRK